jgi:hypothetical protein
MVGISYPAASGAKKLAAALLGGPRRGPEGFSPRKLLRAPFPWRFPDPLGIFLKLLLRPAGTSRIASQVFYKLFADFVFNVFVGPEG